MIFGSRLYGTFTEHSDTDFKGVALPTGKQIVLGNIPIHALKESTGDTHSKNTKHDKDIEILNLHYFIKEALEGQTYALDMLHAPSIFWLPKFHDRPHPIWMYLVNNREKFYSKNVESFVEYAMGQASKYGIKGSRLNDAKAVLDYLNILGTVHGPNTKLSAVDLSDFPQGEHIKFIPSSEQVKTHPDKPMFDMYEVCDKQFHVSVKIGYAANIVRIYYDHYGDRARKAANDEGIDWKAISHAFRAAYQVRELFTEGTITFPRPEALFLLEVKQGQRKYKNVAPMLEDLVEEVKHLQTITNLPDSPDEHFWEDFLIDTSASIVKEYQEERRLTKFVQQIVLTHEECGLL
jgi:hypothetical protein